MVDNRPKNNNVVRRSNYDEHHDDFPTPPWATRAFFEYVAPGQLPHYLKILEPACGRGHMVGVLREYKFKVRASDKYDYGQATKLANYVGINNTNFGVYDVLFTNPPYKQANAFVQRGLREARVGVAVLLRTIWLESVTRYVQLFNPCPPTRVAVFSRRMQAAHGKLVRNGGAMMSHSWFWWDKRNKSHNTELMWIPPDAQQKLEREEDYR